MPWFNFIGGPGRGKAPRAPPPPPPPGHNYTSAFDSTFLYTQRDCVPPPPPPPFIGFFVCFVNPWNGSSMAPMLFQSPISAWYRQSARHNIIDPWRWGAQSPETSYTCPTTIIVCDTSLLILSSFVLFSLSFSIFLSTSICFAFPLFLSFFLLVSPHSFHH